MQGAIAVVGTPRKVAAAEVIEQLLFGFAPVALVGLVADGEVEARETGDFGRALHEVPRRCAAPGAKAGDIAVVVGGEHVIVAAVVCEAEDWSRP